MWYNPPAPGSANSIVEEGRGLFKRHTCAVGAYGNDGEATGNRG